MSIQQQIVALFFSCVCSLAFAASSATVFQERLSQFRTLTADFDQQIVGAEGEVLQQSQGRLFITRPGQFVWQVMSPEPQTIIANNMDLAVYDPGLNQVTYQKMASDGDFSYPALLLTSTNDALYDAFDVSAIGESTYALTPKRDSALFKQVEMTFSGDKLQRIVIADALGQRIYISLANVKLNAAIPPQRYQLDLPADVDEIKLG